ncbi:MAG TPA: VCBS repeat-containing protein [Burkholderiaceae bacterium]
MVRAALAVAALALASALASALALAGNPALELRPLGAAPPEQPARALGPGQLPHSEVATGSRDVARAWLARPTDRYPHAVLGDALEASQLVVEMRDGRAVHVELPPNRVFEDLAPRLADLDGDGRDEILVVESDLRLGASLSVYGVRADGLQRRASSGFLGQPNRWLNPLGAGDFDGDGKLDLALVATPHIGGALRLYRYAEPALIPFAEFSGVSTHSLGSTELGLGRVVKRSPRDRLLMPDATMRALRLLEWTPGGVVEIARVALPSRPEGSLVPAGENRWRLRLEGGETIELLAR